LRLAQFPHLQNALVNGHGGPEPGVIAILRGQRWIDPDLHALAPFRCGIHASIIAAM